MTYDGIASTPAAIVRQSGSIEELGDGRGRRLLESEDELLKYLRAFVETGEEEVRFTWIDSHGDWHLVEARRRIGVIQREDSATVWLHPTSPPHGLTVRELDVLTLIGGGLTNPEIAAHLELSRRTVSTHVERVLQKLDRTSRAGAAGLAMQQGLMRLPVPGGGRSVDPLTVGHVDEIARGSSRSAEPLARRATPRPYLVGSAFPPAEAGAEGEELRRGSALAISELNAAGGIAGRPIQQLVVDADMYTDAGTRSAFEALIGAEVDAITTGFSFAEQPSSYERASEYGCPLLNVMTSQAQADWVQADPSLGRLFQVGPTETHYGTGFVRLLDELATSRRWRPPNRSLAFVETPVPGGGMLGPMTVGAAERGGWSIDSVLEVAIQGADWAPIMRSIHRTEPAALLIAHFVPDELVRFLRAFSADPTDAFVYAIYAPSAPDFLELAQSLAEGLVWSTLTGVYSDSVGSGFANRYREAFGSSPGRCLGGVAYDQVNLLGRAWSEVGNPRAFGDVAEHLRRTTHRGVNGTYHLANEGQCTLAFPDQTPDPSLGQAHLVFQVQRGEHRVLAPAPYVESEFIAPPWFASA